MTDPTTLLATGETQQRSAEVVDFNVDRDTVDVKLVPYEVEARIGEDTHEVFTRGAFARVDPRRVKVSDQQHNRSVVIGRAVEVTDQRDGAYARLRISDTSAGRDVLTLLRDQALTEVSVEFVPQRRYMKVQRRGEEYLVRHDRATLLGVSPVSHGAYGADARVLAVRAHELYAEELARIEAEAEQRREQLERIRTAELTELARLIPADKAIRVLLHDNEADNFRWKSR